MTRPSSPKRQTESARRDYGGREGNPARSLHKCSPQATDPHGDRTVIEIIIDQFLPYGLDRFHLSVNYKSKILKSFFEELAPELFGRVHSRKRSRAERRAVCARFTRRRRKT